MSATKGESDLRDRAAALTVELVRTMRSAASEDAEHEADRERQTQAVAAAYQLTKQTSGVAAPLVVRNAAELTAYLRSRSARCDDTPQGIVLRFAVPSPLIEQTLRVEWGRDAVSLTALVPASPTLQVAAERLASWDAEPKERPHWSFTATPTARIAVPLAPGGGLSRTSFDERLASLLTTVLRARWP